MKFVGLLVIFLFFYQSAMSADSSSKTDPQESGNAAQLNSLKSASPSPDWQGYKNQAERYYQSAQYELSLAKPLFFR